MNLQQKIKFNNDFLPLRIHLLVCDIYLPVYNLPFYCYSTEKCVFKLKLIAFYHSKT